MQKIKSLRIFLFILSFAVIIFNLILGISNNTRVATTFICICIILMIIIDEAFLLKMEKRNNIKQ